MGYKICSMSNLLETNTCWQNLKAEHSLGFDGYGDISTSMLSNNNCGLIFILFLEDLFQDINDDFVALQQHQITFLTLLKQRAEACTKPIILCIGGDQYQSTIETLKEDTDRKKFHNWLVKEFTSMRDSFENIYFLDLTEVFSQHGNSKMFSERNWYFGRCRLSIEGLQCLAANLSSVLERISNPAKKVLALDCDHTLWGGVVGEDGLRGLTLGQDGIGQAFLDFQKEIVRLYNKGIIIVLVSKNNEKDVWDVFDNHDLMILKREHVVAAQINWNEKSTNLATLAKELDLNVDSFVFWDDNPLERGKMKALMPEVLTINVPKNVLEWPKKLRNFDDFAKFKVTVEDKHKTIQYKARAQFSNDAKKVDDLNSYLRSLNLSPSLINLNNSNVSRAEQMCMKTNQFNLRTKRYNSSDLLAINEAENSQVFLVKLTDNHGDHGLVALLCLRLLNENIVYIDSFLMSCRVLGRHLEAWVLDKICRFAKQKKAQLILAEYIESGRNQISREFLISYGFQEVRNEDYGFDAMQQLETELPSCVYCLQITDYKILNLEVFEGTEQ
jgi:FkbH-like protein